MILFVLLVALTYIHGSYENIDNPPSKRYNEVFVVGGRRSAIRDMPFIADLRIVFVMGSDGACGSTILHPEALLTAGHCVYDPKIVHIIVSIGAAKPYRGLRLKSTNYTAHPLFKNPHPDYDIGVVRTKTKMYLDGVFTKAVVLPTYGDRFIPAKTMITVAGWGRTKYNSTDLSHVLMTTKIPVVALITCQIMLKNVKLSTRLFCAGTLKEKGENICDGDSGGPALNPAGLQVGISSATVECAEKGMPSVFTNVAAMRFWIKQEAGI